MRKKILSELERRYKFDKQFLEELEKYMIKVEEGKPIDNKEMTKKGWQFLAAIGYKYSEGPKHKELREEAKKWLIDRGFTPVDEYIFGDKRHRVDVAGFKITTIGVECGKVPKKRTDFLEKYFDKVVVFPYKKGERENGEKGCRRNNKKS
ncbi:unnamed protein product [marine sediment metagenome]|uniref:Uncharacterized protein n=1 Tax=marine sediment metagenome TaxID=412755 RepID=X1FBM1_9ZZZZ